MLECVYDVRVLYCRYRWIDRVAMADVNYNEATHSIVYTQDGASVCPGPDPMFHWDVRFPERLSRLRLTSDLAWAHQGTCLSPLSRRQQRRARADRSGAAGRYRTQPITFDEIAEVDEDPVGQPSTDLEKPDICCIKLTLLPSLPGAASPGATAAPDAVSSVDGCPTGSSSTSAISSNVIGWVR